MNAQAHVRAQFTRAFPRQTVTVDLELNQGITVLFGASGAGKSVTLRAIAGLVKPDTGCIEIMGVTVFDSSRGANRAPHRRNLAYVPQSFGLFPHMTVEQNIRYGAPQGRDRVAELLAGLGMAGYESRKPHTLSGGQQQRVALARALACESPVLLLDEPFSALDERLREELRRELLRLRTELGLTILFVTHDLREAHLLADQLAVVDAGCILQRDAKEVVFSRPSSRRVAELTGVENLLRGNVLDSSEGRVHVLCEGLDLLASATSLAGIAPGDQVDIGIRAERVNLRRHEPGEEIPNSLRARITGEFAYGNTHTLELEPLGPGPALRVELAARPYEVLGLATQKEWTVELPASDLHVMRPG